jgi:LysM repeat protein
MQRRIKMSLSCQYDQIKFLDYFGDIARQIPVEATLRLPEEYPKIAKIKGGEFRTEPPLLTVNEGLLTISGQFCPHLVYLAEPSAAASYRDGDENDDLAELYQPPTEYGYAWGDEDGVSFEERIEIPGLNPEMLVEVDLKPGTALYERENPEEVVFRGVLDIVVHTAAPRDMELVCDINAQSAARFNVAKEQVVVEEWVGVKTATLPLRSSLLLPGYKPGINRIVNYFVRPAGVEAEMYNGKIAVKGMIEVSAIYVGNDDEGRATEIFVNDWNRDTETAIPFETFMDCHAAGGRVLVEPKVLVKQANLENRTQRELSCRLDLECEVKVRQLVTKELVVGVSSESGEWLDTEKHLFNLEEFSEVYQGAVEFELDLNLPAGMPDVERVLAYGGTVEEFRLEAEDNRLCGEGDLGLWMYYVAEGVEQQRLYHVAWERRNSSSLSISGIIDSPGLSPGAILRSRVELDSLKMELGGPRSLRVRGAVSPCVVAKKPHSLVVLKNCALVTPPDPASRPSMLFYISQPGDTLWKIARKYQTTTEILARVNQVPNPDQLETGCKLLIPKELTAVK